jgi:pimeloyl-ACP methyl ester carboxylesterase
MREETTMPTTRRSGLAIHYELDGSGPPLVLLHGGFSSSAFWRIDGYVDGLRDDHQLVLIDIRGHGQSDKPHEPEAYWSSVLASDVLAVLDEIGLASASLCGFSLGANTALRVAASYPDRVDAIAAIGSGPGQVGFAGLSPEEEDDAWARRFEHEGMAWMVATLERAGRRERARLVGQADPLAMAAWWRGWYHVEPIPQLLTDMAMPSFFAWGELEIQNETLPLLPRGARLVVVPGADHVGVMERPDVILPELRTFLASAAAIPRSMPPGS